MPPKKKGQVQKKQVRKRRPAIRQPRLGRSSLLPNAMPAAFSEVTDGLFACNFGAAAVHDDFPEGGLRMSMRLPAALVAGTYNTGVYNAYGNGYSGFFLNPQNAYYPSYSGFMTPSGSLLEYISVYFRRFRYRKLDVHYVPRIGTSGTGSAGYIGLAFASDPHDVYDLSGNSIDYAMAGRSLKTSRYQPATLRAIETRKEDPADALYYGTAAQDGVSTVANVRQVAQGCVLVRNDEALAGATLTLGDLVLDIVIDLYGPINATQGTIPDALPPAKGLPVRVVSSKGAAPSLRHAYEEKDPISRVGPLPVSGLGAGATVRDPDDHPDEPDYALVDRSVARTQLRTPSAGLSTRGPSLKS